MLHEMTMNFINSVDAIWVGFLGTMQSKLLALLCMLFYKTNSHS